MLTARIKSEVVLTVMDATPDYFSNSQNLEADWPASQQGPSEEEEALFSATIPLWSAAGAQCGMKSQMGDIAVVPTPFSVRSIVPGFGFNVVEKHCDHITQEELASAYSCKLTSEELVSATMTSPSYGWQVPIPAPSVLATEQSILPLEILPAAYIVKKSIAATAPWRTARTPPLDQAWPGVPDVGMSSALQTNKQNDEDTSTELSLLEYPADFDRCPITCVVMCVYVCTCGRFAECELQPDLDIPDLEMHSFLLGNSRYVVPRIPRIRRSHRRRTLVPADTLLVHT